MNEAAVKKTLDDLCASLSAIVPGKTESPPDGMYISTTSVEAPSLEETMNHLRLQTKYLMFDLEATRRENRYLRQMLENRNHPPRANGSSGDTDDF
jgi:hypothetical protein